MKNKREIGRRKFISNTALGSFGTIGATCMMSSCMKSGKGNDIVNIDEELIDGIALRPFQLLCAVCAIGEKNIEGDNDKIKAIRNNPDIPVTLLCN